MNISSDQPQRVEDLSQEELLAICEAVDVIACECPGYLVKLLREVKKFRRYTEGCIEQFPQDAATHHWLIEQADQVDRLLSRTIVELLIREDLLDDQGQLRLDELSQRALRIALSQGDLD